MKSDLLMVVSVAVAACGDSDMAQPARPSHTRKDIRVSRRLQPVAERPSKAPKPLDETLVNKSLEILNRAASALLRDNRTESIGLVREAVHTCPDLGVAHTVLATFLLQDAAMLRAQSGPSSAKAAFEEADQCFQQGLKLLDQGGQPASVALKTFGPVPVTTDEIVGDALAWHGYCLVRLAEVAHAENRFDVEAVLLKRARTQLQAALTRKPTPEAKEVATDLLRRFR